MRELARKKLGPQLLQQYQLYSALLSILLHNASHTKHVPGNTFSSNINLITKAVLPECKSSQGLLIKNKKGDFSDFLNTMQ